MSQRQSFIWCSHCESVQPLVTDAMTGLDVSGRFQSPIDLMCGTCRLVIATTYTPVP